MQAQTSPRTKATPGIETRHSGKCPTRSGGKCDAPSKRQDACKPIFWPWVYSKQDKKKIRPLHGFPTMSAAKSWRVDALSAQQKGALRAPPRLTLREAWDAWIEKAEAGEINSRYKRPYAPSALRGYRADMTNYVLADLGAQRLGDLTWEDFQSLVERLQGLGLSGSKIRNVIIPVQALYRRHRRDVLSDPTDGLDLPEPAGRRERAAAPREAAELLAALPPDLAALYGTAFYAGLRRGELRALRVENLRGLDGEGVAAIKVEHGWDDKQGERRTKSKASEREIPMPETLRLILSAHVETAKRSGHDLIFGRSGESPFTPTHNAKRAAKAWAATPTLTPITLHEARHSYSSMLDAAGISEARSDRYMGHANPSVAARYRHQLDGQLAEDAKRLEDYLTGSKAGKVVTLAATG